VKLLRRSAGLLAWLASLSVSASAADLLPVFDGHIHYNENVWSAHPVDAAFGLFDQAGIRRVLVSSTPNEGTRRLYEKDPRRVIAELRPYRTAADRGNWFNDPEVLKFVEQELKRGIYRTIGEFHLHGREAESPVIGRLVDLAVERRLPVHAHSDERAVEILIGHNPKLKVIWAHAGMSTAPEMIGKMLDRHPLLWAELSYRYDVVSGGKLTPAWREVLLHHAGRILLGTDTWAPSRWSELPVSTNATRAWLAQLPRDVAEQIAWRNAEQLFP
jgi:amidohydrolase family protein